MLLAHSHPHLPINLKAPALMSPRTYFDPDLGSCGIPNSGDDDVVALAPSFMANPANPNTNPKCFKKIRIHGVGGGETVEATVVDTCIGCTPDDIDVSLSVWDKAAPQGDGRVHNIEWEPLF